MSDDEITGSWLRAWRGKLGLSQTEAGRALGRSLSQIVRYELGKQKIPRTVELAARQVEEENNRNLRDFLSSL